MLLRNGEVRQAGLFSGLGGAARYLWRFPGLLAIESFQEKSPSNAEKKQEDGGWINGGFMVMEPEILEHIEGDRTVLEREPLEFAAMTDNLVAYRYKGFWQCMDTMRDKQYLEKLLAERKAPWMVWDKK